MAKKRRAQKKMLREDNRVILYPTFAQRVNGGRHWRVNVCGTVYENGDVPFRKRVLLRLLRRMLDVEPVELERALFKQRIRSFVAPTERGKRITVRIAGRTFALRKATKRSGHFSAAVRLPVADVERLTRRGADGHRWLPLDVLLPDGRVLAAGGRVRLVDETGISVISDIDDTIKVTEVHSRQRLLVNTFLRRYEAIQGMAAVYGQWAERDAVFHYVSSSPCQLYDALAELLEAEQFPPGTFHLRPLRLRDHMLRRVPLLRRRGKAVAMLSLLQAFPRRRFFLVGDSGERDPEIYGFLARKFADRVAGIFIRELPHRPMHADRLRRAFRRLDPTRCLVFQTPDELPRDLAAWDEDPSRNHGNGVIAPLASDVTP